MGKNNRPKTTLTRSISFNQDVFEQMEVRRKALRLDRSAFIGHVLEHQLGLVAHALIAPTPAIPTVTAKQH